MYKQKSKFPFIATSKILLLIETLIKSKFYLSHVKVTYYLDALNKLCAQKAHSLFKDPYQNYDCDLDPIHISDKIIDENQDKHFK